MLTQLQLKLEFLISKTLKRFGYNVRNKKTNYYSKIDGYMHYLYTEFGNVCVWPDGRFFLNPDGAAPTFSMRTMKELKHALSTRLPVQA